MGEAKKKLIQYTLAIMPILLVILIGVYVLYVHHFNNMDHVVAGDAEDKEVYMYVDGRQNATSEWKKRDYDLYGETVDLNARTVDCTLYNNSDYEISDWTLRYNINDECFLNNIWNGIVEIHQDVLTDEKVQTLDLKDYNLEDITLEYLYDGDLLIPLHEGDYFIYSPSEEYLEMPIDDHFKVKNGYNIYYRNYPDLYDYEVTYHMVCSYTSGHQFIILCIMFGLWVFLLVYYVSTLIAYKKAKKEMEIKKSGIMSMSDIYAIIYLVDLKKNEITPISADDDSESIRPKNMTAQEQLDNMFFWDAMESYLDELKVFANLQTLPERLEDKETVVFEYISKTYGWCQIRFFSMERDENHKVTKAIFTIRVIEEEKEELEAASRRVDEAERESKSKSTFLANMSHEIRTPINTVLGLDTMILRESKEAGTLSYARDIKSAASMLLSLINGILDFSKLEAGKMQLVPAEYSLKNTIYDVRSMVKNRIETKNLEFKFNISPNLPNQLYGDDVRLKQILINLLTNSAKYTDEGDVTLSVFGKMQENKVHLLFSVKDTGIGIKEEDMKALTERFQRFDSAHNRTVEGTGIGLNLVVGLLDLMDSELKIISKYGEGSEFYFEIEQDVCDETPIGEIDFEELAAEPDEIYRVSFVAPDAQILAVDDNPLNLMIIENLLKETKVVIDKAESGAKALEMTAEKKYDLIFMDHMMPEMDGIETFHHLKEQTDGKNLHTPVIMLTANALSGAETEYLEEGFTDFLAKPIDPGLLEEKTGKYIPQEKMQEVVTEEIKAKSDENLEKPNITGIDVDYGINHTGGVENLITVMNQFSNVAKSDIKELSGYAKILEEDKKSEKGLNSYRIKVHAMKSSANVMGALQVFGFAAILERAARNDKVEEILCMHPYFAEEWLELQNSVDIYLKNARNGEESEDTDVGEIDTETLTTLLHQLEVAMNNFDVNSSDAIVKELANYKFKGQKQEIFGELKTAVANLDPDTVASCCKRLLS